MQGRTKVLINDDKLSNYIDSLQQRQNVTCTSLFYQYFNGIYLREIKGPVYENRIYPSVINVSEVEYMWSLSLACI